MVSPQIQSRLWQAATLTVPAFFLVCFWLGLRMAYQTDVVELNENGWQSLWLDAFAFAAVLSFPLLVLLILVWIGTRIYKALRRPM